MNSDQVLYFSSLAIVLLGIIAMTVTLSRGTDCHYRRETWMGIGIYLIISGIFRIVSQTLDLDQTFSREVTGIMAFFVCIGTIITSIQHFLFHKFLKRVGIIIDPK